MSLASLTENLIETLYRFEGSEITSKNFSGWQKPKNEKRIRKNGGFRGRRSRLGSRTAAKQIPQTRNCSPMKIEDAAENAP